MDFRQINLPRWETVDAGSFQQALFECPQNSLINGKFWLGGLSATGVAWGFQGARIIKRGTGSAALVGLPVVLVDQRDAGAALWSATLGISGDDLMLTTAGVAGAGTITWSVAGWLEITSM